MPNGIDSEVTLDATQIGADRLPKAGSDTTNVGLLIVWSRDEPWRVGEVVLTPRRARHPRVFGRGASDVGAGQERVLPTRQRPGVNEPGEPVAARRISRTQLRLQNLKAGKLMVENIGRCELRFRGEAVAQAVVGEGDLLELADQLLFLGVERPETLPKPRFSAPAAFHPFAEPDANGLVGESVAMWQLRDRVGFVAPRPGHVLVLGRSGVGKELVARALHAQSDRNTRRLVSRNAATIPAGLMDAELFGHVRNYPNPGMAERRGLVGEADASSLFLDEIGEIPPELQAHLLRLMDRGEYQRLGESTARHADLRIIAATNRAVDLLKSDFAARFRHRIAIPPLQDRREDVPLLARHLVRAAISDDPDLGERFMADGPDGTRYPRLSSELVAALLGHPLELQIRELDQLLWRCLAESTGDIIEPCDGLDLPIAEPEEDTIDPGSLTREQVVAALDESEWHQEQAWRALGLASRYQLRRLLRKHDIKRD